MGRAEEGEEKIVLEYLEIIRERKTKPWKQWRKKTNKVRQKRLIRGQTSKRLKNSKRTFNCCCWGPLSLSRLKCDQPASRIKISHTLWNRQNKTGSERRREKEKERWKDWEEREHILPRAYQVCWLYHRGSWLQSVYYLLNTSLRPCFSRPTERHSENTLQGMALTLFTQLLYVVWISHGGKVHPEHWKVGLSWNYKAFVRIFYFDNIVKHIQIQVFVLHELTSVSLCLSSQRIMLTNMLNILSKCCFTFLKVRLPTQCEMSASITLSRNTTVKQTLSEHIHDQTDLCVWAIKWASQPGCCKTNYNKKNWIWHYQRGNNW